MTKGETPKKREMEYREEGEERQVDRSETSLFLKVRGHRREGGRGPVF